jgi:hypothetical protein
MEKALGVKRTMALGLTTVVLATGLALIIAEILLRVLNPAMSYAYMPYEVHVSHFRKSSFLPSELRPNNRSRFKMLEFDTTVITNSMGLRDNEVDFSKPRVLCMGDSFTFGFGVENDETFCSILEQLFQGKYDFLNAGFADGFSPDTYALWLSKYRKDISPKGLIVCISENDLDEVNSNFWIKADKVMTLEDQGLPDRIEKKGFIVTEDGAGLREGVIAKLPPSMRRLLKRSYLIAFLRDRLLHDIDWSMWAYQPRGKQPQQDAKFIRSLELLRHASGDRLTGFYLIPSLGQTGPSRTHSMVIEFAARYGVPVFSNYRDFSKADYFPLDVHFNRAGHLKAARYLHRALSLSGF